MKKTVKGFLMGTLSTTFIFSGIVYASTGTKSIEVIYDNIKIYKDNVLCEVKDANGTVIEPFIYNGTTYMPVRGTADLAGMQVTWDGASKTVYLWDKIPANETYLMEVCPPYDASYNCHEYYTNKGEYFSMGGESYSNGMVMDYAGNYALSNLNGKYSSLECTIGHTKNEGYDKSISFFVDGKLVKTVTLEAERLPKKVSIPLSNGLQLKIMSNKNDSLNGGVGIGNIILK